ncbi:hypothetical protein C0992_008933 [Termitomyces sp. T32_za158]|nr:hypothetical protein C0992_008933 [Termitomyces sp. T32_za158]
MTLPPKRGDAGAGYSYVVEFGKPDNQDTNLNSTRVHASPAIAPPPLPNYQAPPQPMQATGMVNAPYPSPCSPNDHTIWLGDQGQPLCESPAAMYDVEDTNDTRPPPSGPTVGYDQNGFIPPLDVHPTIIESNIPAAETGAPTRGFRLQSLPGSRAHLNSNQPHESQGNNPSNPNIFDSTQNIHHGPNNSSAQPPSVSQLYHNHSVNEDRSSRPRPRRPLPPRPQQYTKDGPEFAGAGEMNIAQAEGAPGNLTQDAMQSKGGSSAPTRHNFSLTPISEGNEPSLRETGDAHRRSSPPAGQKSKPPPQPISVNRRSSQNPTPPPPQPYVESVHSGGSDGKAGEMQGAMKGEGALGTATQEAVQSKGGRAAPIRRDSNLTSLPERKSSRPQSANLSRETGDAHRRSSPPAGRKLTIPPISAPQQQSSRPQTANQSRETGDAHRRSSPPAGRKSTTPPISAPQQQSSRPQTANQSRETGNAPRRSSPPASRKSTTPPISAPQPVRPPQNQSPGSSTMHKTTAPVKNAENKKTNANPPRPLTRSEAIYVARDDQKKIAVPVPSRPPMTIEDIEEKMFSPSASKEPPEVDGDEEYIPTRTVSVHCSPKILQDLQIPWESSFRLP